MSLTTKKSVQKNGRKSSAKTLVEVYPKSLPEKELRPIKGKSDWIPPSRTWQGPTLTPARSPDKADGSGDAWPQRFVPSAIWKCDSLTWR
jgi:hypothetical protein